MYVQHFQFSTFSNLVVNICYFIVDNESYIQLSILLVRIMAKVNLETTVNEKFL